MSPLHSSPKVQTYPQLAQVRGLRRALRTKVAPKSGPTPSRVGAESHEHRAQVGHRDRAHLALGGPKHPAHATTYQTDRLFLGRGVVARGPVRR
jgi:hypothetical protein